MKERKKKREKMAFLPLFWPKPVAQKEAQSPDAAQPTPGAQTRAPDPRSPTPDPRPTRSRNPPTSRHVAARHWTAWKLTQADDAGRWRHLTELLGRASRARVSHAPAEKEECTPRASPETGIRPGVTKISQKTSQSVADTWLPDILFWEIVFSPP